MNSGQSIAEPEFAALQVRYLLGENEEYRDYAVIQGAALEVEICWSEQEQAPYIARFGAELDGELLAVIISPPQAGRAQLTEFNFAHPLLRRALRPDEQADQLASPGSASSPVEDEIWSLAREAAADRSTPDTPDDKLRIAVATRNGALPDLNQELTLGIRDPSVRKAEIEERTPRVSGLRGLLSEMVLGPARIIRDHLCEMTYIGPLREIPSRSYRPQVTPDEARWASGLAAWDLLYSDRRGELVGQVNSWLSNDLRLDTGYPVIVATGMAIEDIVAARSPEEYFHYVLGAVLSVVILLGIYWAMRQLSASIERDRRLQQSQRLEAIGQLTAGIAHDFNNILTAIEGNVERALSAKKANDRRALLGIVQLAAQRGERVVRNLLAYSRQQQLRPQPINLNEAVQNVVELLQAGLGSEWAVRCELALRLAPVMADGSQIETALLNLAINARDAMPAGGPIVLTTRLVEASEADSPRVLAKGRYVAISVQDSGAGMPPSVAAKAFDPFFTTKAQGTGLGLSQVYGLAKQLGGTATIDTREQVGTTVTLYLPVMPAQAPMQAPQRPEVSRTGTPTILVADDHRLAREFICSELSDADYEVIETDNGLSALDTLERSPVHLAVLDVSMPGLSGIEVYARARQSGWNGAVLFVSGFANPANVALMDGKPFLGKPFRAQVLRDQVAKILDETGKPSPASQP